MTCKYLLGIQTHNVNLPELVWIYSTFKSSKNNENNIKKLYLLNNFIVWDELDYEQLNDQAHQQRTF